MRRFMDGEMMKELAFEAGFCNAEVIPTREFYFVPEYREYCVQNLCGNYNRNYGCPPYCGTPEEMRDKVLRYRRALVLQSQADVNDVYDVSQTKAPKKAHTMMTLKLIRMLKQHGMTEKGVAIMAGPCNFCDVCQMVNGAPCPFEDSSFSCLSAYCIDVGHLATSCRMDMSWTGNIVSFFSIYLFDCKTDETVIK